MNIEEIIRIFLYQEEDDEVIQEVLWNEEISEEIND
jgi:hypothetical protein